MKKSRSVFASFLIILFCLTMLTPTVLVSIETSNTSSLLQTESNVAIDGDSGSIIVPVWKNEQVLNSSPDTNHNGITNLGGLWVGIDGSSGLARSFVSFNLNHIPRETAFVSARLFAFMSGEFPMTTNDTPIAVYYCEDDLWDETVITWNNQPTSALSPSDVIDSPVSPDMFVLNNWYSWDVTTDVRTALAGDKLLTELIKNVDENALPGTGKGFAKTEYSQFNATYLELSYTTPTITDFAVDGHSSGQLLDYVQDDTPLMSWTHVDPDADDFQYGYQLEVWDDPLYNETLAWSDSSTSIQPVFYENSSINTRPFGTDTEVRFQFKYDSSILNRSGTVDKLHFYVVEDEGMLTFENLVVRMASTSTAGALGSDFEGNYGTATPITVLRATSFDAVIHNSILTVDIENTFVMSHDLHLIIEFRFMNVTGTLAWSEIDGSSTVGWVAYEYGVGDYFATTAGYTSARCHSLDIELASTDIFSTVGSAPANFYPFNTDDGSGGRIAFKYNSSLLDQTGYIDKIFFRVGGPVTNIVFEDFEVTLCETPVLGHLSQVDWSYNYGGVTPTSVLDESQYTIVNRGDMLMIDVDNSFYYENRHDLLIELIWGNKVSGSANCLRTDDAGGYRAWNVTESAINTAGNGTRTYHMFADFIKSEFEVEYSGVPLVDTTRYYCRIRTCDSTGIWTSWSELDFKYEVLTSAPEFDGPVVTPSPVTLGSDVEVATNVTYFLGVNQVLIEYDGSNHTMSAIGDRYSHTWTPTESGFVNFTIFMESAVGTWSEVDGSFSVITGVYAPVDPLMFIIIGAGIIVVIVLVVVVKRRRS